jgi:hypothetical protein
MRPTSFTPISHRRPSHLPNRNICRQTAGQKASLGTGANRSTPGSSTVTDPTTIGARSILNAALLPRPSRPSLLPLPLKGRPLSGLGSPFRAPSPSVLRPGVLPALPGTVAGVCRCGVAAGCGLPGRGRCAALLGPSCPCSPSLPIAHIRG